MQRAILNILCNHNHDRHQDKEQCLLTISLNKKLKKKLRRKDGFIFSRGILSTSTRRPSLFFFCNPVVVPVPGVTRLEYREAGGR